MVPKAGLPRHLRQGRAANGIGDDAIELSIRRPIEKAFGLRVMRVFPTLAVRVRSAARRQSFASEER